ncbi:hypothetical protein TanjilG_28876 [Lupinus angustifolius]|uniref:TPX2 C-terminal domain-containing protein n=1 Tax=Lupinus angustifolius TaxID=3871 RepID=A0A4P1R931_LUPAN|nr:PREDICTED: calponin homology domain-containing protein DDB_G0272472-like [Lupinus angustifolius]OIW05411.1 hypothetical protein TanjilG_28876 [Lupinus angustifolius]
MATKNTVTTLTPKKDRSKIQESSKSVENFNPNVSHQSPVHKTLSKSSFSSSSSSVSPISKKSSSPSTISKSQKKPSASKNPNYPRNKIRERKFLVVAKKNNQKKIPEDEDSAVVAAEGSTVSFCKCKEKKNKCLCVAYENLRKSQEEFFKNCGNNEDNETKIEVEDEKIEMGTINNTKKRDRLMEDSKEGVFESGCGKVMNLVKAFENMQMSFPKEKEEKEIEESNSDKKVVMKWPLQQGLEFCKENESCSSFLPSDCVMTSENLGLDQVASLSSSWDSSRRSSSRRISTGSGRSRRNSLESSSSTIGGRRWKKKQMRITSQKPFKLRTEQRGKLKEEEFVKKIQEKMTEEERQRIPIAQGLPLTTDEPECLLKPPVKEITIPIDLTLHSDVRAMDRAEFDHQVAEKLSLIEQYKLERERQRKLAEEEEVKRLRKELIPKAQPMPFFDRPFIPRRSVKNPTIPQEPKFRIPQNKKIKSTLSSWNDMMSSYSSCNLDN